MEAFVLCACKVLALGGSTELARDIYLSQTTATLHAHIHTLYSGGHCNRHSSCITHESILDYCYIQEMKHECVVS